jgi:hypothetical protein
MAVGERHDRPGMKLRRGGSSFVCTVPRLVAPGMKAHGDRFVARRRTGQAQRLPSRVSRSTLSRTLAGGTVRQRHGLGDSCRLEQPSRRGPGYNVLSQVSKMPTATRRTFRRGLDSRVALRYWLRVLVNTRSARRIGQRARRAWTAGGERHVEPARATTGASG